MSIQKEKIQLSNFRFYIHDRYKSSLNYLFFFDEKIKQEQISLLYRSIGSNPRLAVIAAIIMIWQFSLNDFFNYTNSFIWLTLIFIMSESHILLIKKFLNTNNAQKKWRTWSRPFLIFCTLEGIMWGLAPIILPSTGRMDVTFSVILVCTAVASINITVFGAYLPAFFVSFIPTMIGSIVSIANSSDNLYKTIFILLVFYFLCIGLYAFIINSIFIQNINLKFFAENQSLHLKEQKEIAEKASLAKSTFLAAASHDLRQPVHATGMLVGALRSIPMSLEGQEILAKIEESTNAMDTLFVALLDISKLDAGVVQVEKRSIALEPIISRTCREFNGEAELLGLTLTSVRTSVNVNTDPILFERILRNFISNALRYTTSGKILVGCRRSGKQIKIQVWDTGIGLADDARDRIFEEYYQVGNQERDRTKGLGLGLAIVQRMSTLLESTVSVRSELGRGSCFEISLPMANNIDKKDEPILTQPAFRPKFIVVVDDDKLIRGAMKTLLTGWGHSVCIARSGKEAISILGLNQNVPDLILSDYRLSENENGFDVINYLREEYNRQIPAILISGDTDKKLIIKSSKVNIKLLQKPLQYELLRKEILNNNIL